MQTTIRISNENDCYEFVADVRNSNDILNSILARWGGIIVKMHQFFEAVVQTIDGEGNILASGRVAHTAGFRQEVCIGKFKTPKKR